MESPAHEEGGKSWVSEEKGGPVEAIEEATGSNQEAMVKMISFEQSEVPEQQSPPVETVVMRPYATKEEKERMRVLNPHRLRVMRQVLKGLEHLRTTRALDVACGAGQLSRYVLVNKFEKVDLFDHRCLRHLWKVVE